MTLKCDEIELRIAETIIENTFLRNKLKDTQDTLKHTNVNFKTSSKALYETTENLEKTKLQETDYLTRLKVAERVIDNTFK